VVLDNASYHQGEKVWAKLEEWVAKGLYLWYLPPYSPELNPIERVWRSVKGELMPRRSYADGEALRAAFEAALQQVGGRVLGEPPVGVEQVAGLARLPQAA
jgi:transposase